MDEEERSRTLVYMHAMLGMNAPGDSESAASLNAATGQDGQGKDEQFLVKN